MRVIKATTQNFLSKILELGISISLKYISLKKKELIGDILPVLYTQVVKNVPFFQKLKSSIEKNFGNVPIIVCVKTDVRGFGAYEISHQSPYIKDERGDSYYIRWNVKYWQLYIFLEKNKNENIWLYAPKCIYMPVIYDIDIPENINLETLKKRIRSGDFLIEGMVDSMNRFHYTDVKVIPVNVPAVFVDYLLNRNVMSPEVIKDVLQRVKNKHIEQIFSILKDNANSFIKFLVSYCLNHAREKISESFDTGIIHEWFSENYRDVINSIVEEALKNIKSEMENKIEEMSLEELKYYNNGKIIYRELIKIADSIDIPLDFTSEIEEFVIRDFYETEQIEEENFSDWLEDYSRSLVDLFATGIDENIGAYYRANSPFMVQIIKKLKINKKFAEETYNLFSETEVGNNYLEFFKTWKKNLFTEAFEKFLELYGKDKLISTLSLKIKQIFEEEMNYVVNRTNEIMEKEVLDLIRWRIDSKLIGEIQALIEERLQGYADYEE